MNQDSPTESGSAPGLTSPPPSPGTASKEDSNIALLMYVLAIITGWIAPLIIWLIKKDQSPFINDQGKEVLNFEITVFLAMIVASLSCFIAIGIVLVPLVVVCNFVFMIMGAVAVSKGKAYRFPFAIRLIK